ncbi:MAG: M13 family metallopeptidase [Clostridia bacterium]|nr:M13 family metallopeptidase [Clostridia bacterium]
MKHMKHWMTALAALVLALAMAFGAFAEALPAEEPAELYGSPWVNSMVTGNLPETAPDLKDDFYAAVNYDVLAANQEGMYMPIMTAGAEVEAAVTALLQDGSAAGDDVAQLKIFWEQAADMEALRAAGYSGVTPYLDRISAAASLEELNAVLTAEDFPFSPYLTMPVAPLALNEENGVWIYPALALTTDFSNGMNNYTEPAADLESLSQKVSSLERADYLLNVLTALGVEAENITDTALDLFNTEVSYVSKTYSEAAAALADYGYISDAPQRLSPEELDSFCSRFPLSATLKKFGKDAAAAYIVLYPDWLKALDALWTEENLDRLKLLTGYKVLMEAAPFLSPDYVNDMRAQSGKAPLDEATNPWYVCNRVDTFGHLLGKLYAEQVLGSGLKEKLTVMTQELIDTYRTLLNETEWLSVESREKALEKLDNMRLGILEPDGGYYDFSGLKLTPSSEGGSLFSNYLALKAYLNDQENSLIGKPAKADLAWKACYPLMTNCFYDPFSNSVNLLPGFMFSYNCPEDATEEQMLGGLGTVIAHELSHAFDYAGSQCDAYGRGIGILGEADREIFLSKVKAVEDYYNAITVMPDVYCRGTFLRVENTADLAGMKAAALLAKTKGLDLQAFFRENARLYAAAVPEAVITALQNDPHALSYLRVNVNLQMLDEFYEAFDVQEGDGMYVKPEDRLKTWGK